jgi:cation-transporting ATPase E
VVDALADLTKWTDAMTEITSTGLTAAEVAERVERGLVNRVHRSDAAEYRDIVARNVLTLFNALVVPAAVALFLMGEYPGAWSVSAMALINTVLGLVQEIRAKRRLDKLAILVETHARVVRDGAVQSIPAGDVVQDEQIFLSVGEPVVADGVVLEARFLEVDEALLTGESDPVPRHPGDRLLSGSFGVAGEGVYRADKVGGEAFAQRTAVEAREYRYAASPIQKSINLLIKILTGIAVALCLLYVVFHFLRATPTAEDKKEQEKQFVQMVAATVTSMVPQGLVLMATVAMTLGAVRMSARGAVVQRLSAVESMAAVNVLCMDKTGTLTTNRLRLARLCTLDGMPEEAVRDRLRLFAALTVDRDNKSIQALRTALGPEPGKVELVDQLPFKSQNRYSAVRVRSSTSEQVLVLGACEALQPFLLQPNPKPEIRNPNDMLSDFGFRISDFGGLRLLLFAETSQSDPPPFQGSLQGFVLRPLALVALSDELRPEAGSVLEALAVQGIGFKIISGDNPETVRATVGHLDLPLAHEPVVSGDQLAHNADPAHLIGTRGVFGRVAPRQKVQIVATLQEQGRHVAMLGDGVNDVLPIKRADLGIAMGEGSSASKTVAGLVLENNNFELLPATLEEGRTIIRNLRRSGKLFLVKNVYSLILIVLGLAVFGLPFPYLPQQVTLLNTLTIGIPAFLITLSKERSTGASRPGFLREIAWFVLPTGLVLGLAGLTIFLISAHGQGDDLRTQRTLVLSTLVLLGLGNLLRVLTHGEPARLIGDTRFRWLAAAVVPVYLAAMYLQPIAHFFELASLTWRQWGLVVAVAVSAFGACKLLDWVLPA